MKHLLAFLLSFVFSVSALAQGDAREGMVSAAAASIRSAAGAPSGSCSPASTGAVGVRIYGGAFYYCNSGTWAAMSGGGGTTINSTNGQLPYRVNSTTFGDSAIASNALNSTYLSVTSGASGAGVTVAVAGGGTNENLILSGKGTGGVGIGASDVLLQRDAANTLAQRNGANAQAFRVYGAYTDASNYDRLHIGVVTTGRFDVRAEQAGSGSVRGLYLGTTGNAGLQFYTNNTLNWNIATAGHLLANTDNTYDIGASGANRPRNIFTAADIFSGRHLAAAASGSIYWVGRSVIYSKADGNVLIQNQAETDFDRLQFGGTSASFPALKRSTANLQVRLADDSGFAAIQSLYIRFGSGSPEGAVTAPVGAIYSRTDGGAGTSFYVKESGTGNTGWVAK